MPGTKLTSMNRYFRGIIFLLVAASQNSMLKGQELPSHNKVEVDSLIFPRGEKITNSNFAGTAYLKTLVEADSMNSIAVGNVTFEAGARTKWHLHPGGQILLVMGGVGFYQEKGQDKRTLRKGDVIRCPPNVPHWHGASTDSTFIQVAITNNQNGPTIWLHEVTDKEYRTINH